MPAEGERFRATLELSFEIRARDYYSANMMGENIGHRAAEALYVADDDLPAGVSVRVLSVERQEP
jgi:hypothetical protein